jgi:hypothetical protein
LTVFIQHSKFKIHKMLLLITGCAGFIGSRTTALALEQGHAVVGLDNLNDYYDVRIKRHRLEPLLRNPCFRFHQVDIEDGLALDGIALWRPAASRRPCSLVDLRSASTPDHERFPWQPLESAWAAPRADTKQHDQGRQRPAPKKRRPPW